jgi:hypothetical protein
MTRKLSEAPDEVTEITGQGTQASNHVLPRRASVGHRGPSLDAAAVKDDALATKLYRADLCFFAAARFGKTGSAQSPPQRSSRLRAIRACELAVAQVEPEAPSLDQRLRSFAGVLRTAEEPSADAHPEWRARFDEEWSQLGQEVEAWRAAHPVQPSAVLSESQRLARAAFERGRSIVLSKTVRSGLAEESEVLQFKDSIVALATYGTNHDPDAWITVVEPALEALLREMQGGSGRNLAEQDGSSLLRVFLSVIEAYQRALASQKP